MREGKIRKLRKEIGLPHFGDEKKKLEQRVDAIVVFTIYRIS